jgi:surfactin synthase thioesterase subunit
VTRPVLNLLCLPYAGGSASMYRLWPTHVPPWLRVVALELPGRGARLREGALAHWPALLDTLAHDARPWLDRPYALFGHSMGALIALELAHLLRARHGATPVWLGVSACTAPSRRKPEHQWLSCPRSELLNELRALNGTPPELLDNAEFMAMIEPALRADFHLCGTHVSPPREPLHCPVLALCGQDDMEIVREPENLRAWQRETDGRLRTQLFQGGHFFIQVQREAVLAEVVRELAAVTESFTPPPLPARAMHGCGGTAPLPPDRQTDTTRSSGNDMHAHSGNSGSC